ncbi:hypothetical protein, partial [Pseudoalteromonas sp. bablab_jr004]|uniref:hypothetical protein n=1 Tax=Pseudoalteromonas sp. bablab_jr004 TaxID=2755065 RepID=UPI001A7E95C3
SVVRKKIFNSQRGYEALRFRGKKLSKLLVYLILFSFTSLCANLVKTIFEPQRTPRRFALHRETK